MLKKARFSKKAFICLAWYPTEDDWIRIKNDSVDKHLWEAHYDDWKDNFENRIEHMGKKGLEVTRVEVKYSELKKWCDENKSKIDGESRCQFATKKLGMPFGMRLPQDLTDS